MFGRKTLKEIASTLDISFPTLQKAFDSLDFSQGLSQPASTSSINLIIDATFFGREYGYLCFHDTKRVIWFKEIKTENVHELRKGLYALKDAGYTFKSVTIDGRRGYYNNIKKVLGPVPIQMCLYHQKAIIRRYITDRPKTLCGQELKGLMALLCLLQTEEFIERFYQLKDKYKIFLNQRNANKTFKHQKLRAAFRSLAANLPYLLTFRDIQASTIPSTINHLEGMFSHLKEKVKIHRGLNQSRKKNAIICFLLFC